MSDFFNQRRALLFVLTFVLIILLVPAGTTEAADAQWFAQYYNNTNLSGEPVLERFENDLSNEWGERYSPAAGVNQDEFSVRWTRTINFPDTGTYRFSATMDDGMRVFVDNNLVIDAWNVGPTRTRTADVYLIAGDHAVRVEYFDQLLNATAIFTWQFVNSGPPVEPPINNWRGEYYNNTNLTGAPVVIRDDRAIEFDWGIASPAGPVNADNFSVRWTRTWNLDPGQYRFTATTDDGVRLWVNGRLLIDQWHTQAVTSYAAETTIQNNPVSIRMEYFEETQLAEAHLNWILLSDSTPPPFPQGNTATVIADLANVRQGPSTSFSILETYPQGTELQLGNFRTADNKWVQVFLPNGTQGWTFAPLWDLSVPVTSLPVRTDSGFPDGPYATVFGAFHLNVRQGPGVEYETFTTISRDMVVELHGRNINGNWLYIRMRDGRYGWASASYLQTSVPVDTLPITS